MLDDILKNLFKFDSKGDGEMAQLGRAVIFGGPVAVVVLAFLFPKKAVAVWGILWGKVKGPATTAGEITIHALITLATLIGLAAVGFIFLQVYYYWRAGREVRYYRILPHRSTQIKTEKILKFTKDLHQRHRVWYKRCFRGREWFRWLIYCNQETGEIEFYMGYPQDKENGVKHCFRDHFPSAERLPVAHDQLPLPGNQGTGGYFALNDQGERAGLPLSPLDQQGLVSVLTHLEPGTWLDLRYSSEKGKRKLKKRVKKGLTNLGLTEAQLRSIFQLEVNHPGKSRSDLDPMDRARYKSLFEQHTGREKAFQVALYLWSQPPKDPENILSEAVYEDVRSQVHTTMEHDNFIYAKRLRSLAKKLNPIRQTNPMPWPIFPKMLWTHSEIGNLLHLPQGPTKEQEERDEQHVYDQVQHLVKGQKLPPDDEYQVGLNIGYLNHPINKHRVIRIGQNIIRKMGSIVGDIGSGKSALLLMMMQSLLDEWYEDPKAGGFTGVDPKGVLANTLKTRILKGEKDGKKVDRQRIHVIDLASTEFAFGLNLLHRHPWQTLDQVVDDTLTVLKSAYSGDSILLDKYGRLGLKALLLDHRPHTILALGEFLDKESPLRDRLLKQLEGSEDTTRKALAREIRREKFGGKDTEVLRNRLIRLKDNQIARRMFGQKKNSLKVLDWIDQGHIVMFNCQNLPPDVLKITMNYITHQYWQLAQRRKYKQKNHPLIIDEAHLVQLPILSDMIEVLRDFGLPLYMCTQYYGQYEDPLMLAALGLVGTKIAFKQEDKAHAKIACEKAGNSFEPQDIQRLKAFEAALYVEDSKGEKRPMLIRTDPPYIFGKDGQPTYFGEDKDRIDREKNQAFEWADQELARPLQERDCTPVEKVDREIDEYLESLWEMKEKKTQKGKAVEQFEIPKPEPEDQAESDAPAPFSIPKGE
ncbi:hypothetical protein GCM10007416_34000 [Kroppenstedtia guangzhouensis]|uniref:Uncharacterized protein n=1 Tax=Kroppenstedtia guangzhouensis TaxID=1274356 RepID=A0ABQ1H404_9BACL|nr:ATP-binding protein [Kroppenstedtia guangzhouensis]GGA57988.1 hypothetical protein GCM10007416_34000 [Kroppenstedtia guangzhouensis]